LPKIARAIRSIADNNAAHSARNILRRNRARRRVAVRNMAAVADLSSQLAAIAKAATSIGPAPAHEDTSGVSVRVKGEKL